MVSQRVLTSPIAFKTLNDHSAFNIDEDIFG